jgi:replicative DNA helicase
MAHPSTRLKDKPPSPAPERPAPEREEPPAYRMLPHNMEAEQGLLGALLVDNRAMEKIGDFLRQDHFFVPAHKRIYAAIEKLIERGQNASPVTLKGYFEKDEGLANVGGASYLASSPSSTRRITAARFTICICAAS